MWPGRGHQCFLQQQSNEMLQLHRALEHQERAVPPTRNILNEAADRLHLEHLLFLLHRMGSQRGVSVMPNKTATFSKRLLYSILDRALKAVRKAHYTLALFALSQPSSC